MTVCRITTDRVLGSATQEYQPWPNLCSIASEDPLHRHSVSFTVLWHEAVYTSQQAADIRGTSLASGAKALVCKGDDRFVLFVLPANLKLDTATDEDVIESARYALRHGMPGGGYVFATSNCIYTGMSLRRYELMLDIWRKEGNYPG